MEYKQRLIALLQKELSEDAIKKSIISIDYAIQPKGAETNIAKIHFTYPYDGFMVFVDLEPKLNWTHDCLYLFISADLSQLTRIKAETPPYYGDYPKTYSVVLRYGSIPEDEYDFNPFNL